MFRGGSASEEEQNWQAPDNSSEVTAGDMEVTSFNINKIPELAKYLETNPSIVGESADSLEGMDEQKRAMEEAIELVSN